jgi:acetate kinase
VRLLVVNAGSSSLKLDVLSGRDETLGEKSLEWPRDAPFPAGALDDLPEVDAVGHRVVHGGDEFRDATWIDDEVRARLEALTPLAPQHQPRALAGIDGTATALPGVRAAACFDTAFHATLPPAAATYALPAAWRERWGLRRFGFHGLSHAYATRRAAELLDRPYASLRIVSCHLGAGASLAAVAGGRSVDTTMGFTPLEGLVMATRAGSVDPGLLVWLQQEAGLGVDELADALEHDSGLAGLAGSGDMRALLDRDDDAARLALDVYLHRLRAAIAAMAAALGGLDALVFTGGVGEHAAVVRAGAADGLAFLGVRLDAEGNAAAHGDADITGTGAGAATLVVTAREDREIARQVRALPFRPPART